MGTSPSPVSVDLIKIMSLHHHGYHRLCYEGEEVPGEVRALQINPVIPQQVSVLLVSSW